MDDEILKRKYRFLVMSLSEVNNNIDELVSEIKSLCNLLNDNFLLDDNYYKKEEIEDILLSIRNTKSIISEQLIPNARRKGNN